QVVAISALRKGRRCARQLLIAQPAAAPGDLLGGPDLEALALFDGLDELARLEQRVEGAGVEPRGAARKHLDVEAAGLKVEAVEVGDLVLAASAGLEVASEGDHGVVVEVQAGHGELRLGGGGLLLERQRLAGRVELNNTVGGGVSHAVGKDHRAVDVCEALEVETE